MILQGVALSDRKFYLAVGALFLVAASIRLVYITTAPDWPIRFGDGSTYIEASRALLNGDWPTFLKRAQLWGPGFLLLVLPLSLGGDPTSIVEWSLPLRIAQAVVGALTCVVVALTGRATRSRDGAAIGVLAGSMLAIHPTQILYTNYILTEVLGTFVGSVGLLLAYRANTAKQGGLAGVILGASALCRMTIAYSVILVPAAAAIRNRRAAATMVIGGVGIPVAWALFVGVVGGTSFVGSGGIASRLSSILGSADPAHFAWLGDRNVTRSDFLHSPAWSLKTEDGTRWIIDPDTAQIVGGKQVTIAVRGEGRIRYIAPYQVKTEWQVVDRENGNRFDLPLVHRGNFSVIELDGSAEWVELRLPAVQPLAGTAVRVATNAFLNFWYADEFGNLVEQKQFPSFYVQLLQRTIVIFAIFGLVLAAFDLRTWGLTAAMLLAGLAVGFKWVEQRHNFVFMPAACLLGSMAIFWGVRSHWSQRAYAVAGGAALGACIAFLATRATPAWQYSVEPADAPHRQTIRHPEGVQFEKAAILVDLTGAKQGMSARVSLNGEDLGALPLRPLYPTSGEQAGLSEVYHLYAEGMRYPLDAWPQWWALDVDPKLLSSIETKIEIEVPSPGVKIGVSPVSDAGEIVGPSLSRTSLYRWRTTEDWRFWESVHTDASGRTEGLGVRLLFEDAAGQKAFY